tara:strand:+ start:676 stop:840 length:165 start_codon:yes stop_codon:yes gene_type:complete
MKLKFTQNTIRLNGQNLNSICHIKSNRPIAWSRNNHAIIKIKNPTRSKYLAGHF